MASFFSDAQLEQIAAVDALRMTAPDEDGYRDGGNDSIGYAAAKFVDPRDGKEYAGLAWFKTSMLHDSVGNPLPPMGDGSGGGS